MLLNTITEYPCLDLRKTRSLMFGTAHRKIINEPVNTKVLIDISIPMRDATLPQVVIQEPSSDQLLTLCIRVEDWKHLPILR